MQTLIIYNRCLKHCHIRYYNLDKHTISVFSDRYTCAFKFNQDCRVYDHYKNKYILTIQNPNLQTVAKTIRDLEIENEYY
ncbi:MAG: hypothetical protein ACFFA4_16825 [Promethearchaeota archaeon]